VRPFVPFDDPLGRSEDILEAVGKIQRYTAGLTLETFQADEKSVDTVVRNFTILGEAANHVSAELMACYPAVPWHQMRGLRNVVVHEYPRVETRVIREAVPLHLPALVPQLREILEREP
jgi:uncharacterized protein with HEPN domain